MTLKVMQGFETCRDDSDLRAQNWLKSPTLDYAGFPGATTAVGNTGIKQFTVASAAATVVGNASAADLGYYNTGITVNQAWTAGGFTFGASATFYSGTAGAAIGSALSTSQYMNQIVFDGTRYWSIQSNPTIQVVTSTDLITWTATPSQPGGLTGTAGNSVSYMGGGVVMVIPGGGASNIVYYTSNNGSSWSSQSFGAATGPIYGAGCATGNSTYPHCVAINSSNTSSWNGVWIGTLGGTMTQAVSPGAYAATGLLSRPKIINGYIICTLGNNGIYSALASSASLNTTGAWTKWTYTGQNLTDVNYFQPTNVWIVSGYQAGVVTIPNLGGSGTPTPPTTGSGTSVYASPIYGLIVSSTNVTMLPAATTTGNVSLLTSTTAASGSWTNTSRILPYLGANINGFKESYYDGTKWIVVGWASGTSSSQVICTTTDGLNNWQTKYMTDVAPSTTGGFSGLGVCAATAAPTSGSAWTQVGGTAWLNCSTPASNSSTITVYTAAGTTAAFTATQASTTLTHTYEVKATAVPGTTNSFTITLYIDGTLQSGSATVAMGSGTSDTTSLLILNLPRSGNWQQFDDVVFTLDDGSGIVGPLGVMNIVARRPTTDTQAQWTINGSAVSDSLSVNQSALSSQSTNYISTFTDGAKDIYTSSDTLPTNYKPIAVQVEGYFAKGGTNAPVVSLGIQSGSTEVDSSNLTVNNSTATYLSQIVEKDPNGNIAWTTTSVTNSKLVVNKIS
ncbi:hypothetical protein RsoM2USA_421 [Ralstonia phage RsoM2USA]|nr:hypothetical protein RsoM2USA_421 [Ralstonia phage RsoM2USA]